MPDLTAFGGHAPRRRTGGRAVRIALFALLVALCLGIGGVSAVRADPTTSYAKRGAADGASHLGQLDEASGDSFADAIVTADGTWSGSPSLGDDGPIACETNASASLDGSTQSGTIPYDSTFELTNSLTAEAWVKLPAQMQNPNDVHPILERPVVRRDVVGESDYALELVGATPQARFRGSFDDELQLTAPDSLDAGWHHLVASSTAAKPLFTSMEAPSRPHQRTSPISMPRKSPT